MRAQRPPSAPRAQACAHRRALLSARVRRPAEPAPTPAPAPSKDSTATAIAKLRDTDETIEKRVEHLRRKIDNENNQAKKLMAQGPNGKKVRKFILRRRGRACGVLRGRAGASLTPRAACDFAASAHVHEAQKDVREANRADRDDTHQPAVAAADAEALVNACARASKALKLPSV